MRLRPLGSWVLVKDLEDTARSRSGLLFLPMPQDNLQRPALKATVEAVGRKVTRVKPGDRVMVRWSQHLTMEPYAKRVLSLFSQKMRLVQEHKILGVFD